MAQINRHVAFFDDIEWDFGTVIEAEGMLSDVASYGDISLALSELERLAANITNPTQPKPRPIDAQDEQAHP